MCGIVGYIGPSEAEEVILEGLKRLEYRGYDSSGIAVLDQEGKINLQRCEGKIAGLIGKLNKKHLKGKVGVGHTRWATHGRPSEVNAHPHIEGDIALVHNGIIENYLTLREGLLKQGAKFKSETDTEILAHLISREVRKGKKLTAAVRAALKRVQGTYAIAVMSVKEPGVLVGARKECPLVVGLGSGENIISSDVTAMLDITREAVFLDDGEVVTVTKDKVTVKTLAGKSVAKTKRHIEWSPVMAEKGGYRHFMLKEIFEQPRAITDTFRGQVMEERGDIFFNEFNIDVSGIKRIYIIACGTSWHAALVGKFQIEELSGIPTEVDLASEFRYRNPLVGKDTLVIAISQSGETADTLAALKEAKKQKAPTIALCNVVESSLARVAGWTLYTHAGPEIGVASTKAFTTQLTALYMLAIYFGRRMKKVNKKYGVELIKELLKIPHILETILAPQVEEGIKKIAKKYFHCADFLYLGRGINYPIALEGALKLKEISYIHAEGYPAGEMKHGPIALIDEDMPVLVLAPKDAHYPKILGNMQEVGAREGKVIAIISEGCKEARRIADDTVSVPDVSQLLWPIVMTVPLQLLAYHIAVLKGTDVDQPRNLAKSVTVE